MANRTISATAPSANATNATRHTPMVNRTLYGRTYTNSRFNCGEITDANRLLPLEMPALKPRRWKLPYVKPSYLRQQLKRLLRELTYAEPLLRYSPIECQVKLVHRERIRASPTLRRALLINIAMRYFARVLPLLQRFLDFFSEHHRAVFAAGTSERHRQIALALFNVVRHQECQQSFHTSQKFSGLRKGTDESAHFSRASREFSQARNEMRIRQESYIEDQVRIDRHAIFVAET